MLPVRPALQPKRSELCEGARAACAPCTAADGSVRLYDVYSGALLKWLRPHRRAVTALAHLALHDWDLLVRHVHALLCPCLSLLRQVLAQAPPPRPPPPTHPHPPHPATPGT